MVKANSALSGKRTASAPTIRARTPRTTNQAQLRLSSEAPVRVSLPALGWVKLCAIVDIRCLTSLFALPDKAQQQPEQVATVEVERQRDHQRRLVGAFAARSEVGRE